MNRENNYTDIALEQNSQELSPLRDVPLEKWKAIHKLSFGDYANVVRAIRHIEPITKKDFLPTFVDDVQKSIQRMRRSGQFANQLADISEDHEIDYYAMSLKADIQFAKAYFWRDSLKKVFPILAVGSTNPKKGYAYKKNSREILYFLFDFESDELNPINDFLQIARQPDE